MYASVHADRAGRILIAHDRQAAALHGDLTIPFEDAIPLPPDAQLVTLPRPAVALDRTGRARALGRDRLATAAILPEPLRLLSPAYLDDTAAPALAARPYAAVAADAEGRLVVAAAPTASTLSEEQSGPPALRDHPANALARQLARCARENGCAAAKAGLGARKLLPVPLGAPAAERPRLPLDLRSGYASSRAEPATLRPSADEMVAVASSHLERGGEGIAFGRACDGEPLLRIRVLEEAARALRERHPAARIALETSGCDPAALRRACDAGVSEVTVRLASARAGTYELLHSPLAHRWSDVRASLGVAAEKGTRIVVALLVLPGLSDRADEIEAVAAMLGELPGGRCELRDLGCDPLRVSAALPRGRGEGMRALLARLTDLEHFDPRGPTAVR